MPITIIQNKIFHNKIFQLLCLVAIFCVATHWLLGHWLHTFAIQLSQSLQNTSVISFLVFIGLSADIILPIPSSALSIWSVVSLGFTLGFFTIWLGLTTSCILGYALGLYSREWLSKRFFSEDDLRKSQDMFDRYGIVTIMFMRAIPILAEASVFTAGVARMNFIKFMSVSTLANLGIALIYASASDLLQQQESLILTFFASVAIPLASYGAYLLLKQTRITSADVAFKDQTLKPEFNIKFEYPLHFSEGVFATNNHTFVRALTNNGQTQKETRVVFFIDEGVANGNSRLCYQIQQYCDTHNIHCEKQIHLLPGGDQVKTAEHIERMQELLLDAKLDRQSYICAIGGGGLLDAVGYAAATFHRGVRLIRMPTTVLAQNDAGVGVKNGINSQGIKNLYGTFAIPHAIINDSQLLQSLDDRDFRAGFAEAIKVALIRDAEFLPGSVTTEKNSRIETNKAPNI